MAAPMPLEEPVIRAVLPVRGRFEFDMDMVGFGGFGEVVRGFGSEFEGGSVQN